MKADVLSLEAAIANSEVDYYTVPPHQMAYSWIPKKYEELWDYLADAYIVSLAAKNEFIPGKMFLGPLVFVRNEANKSYEIIDGQQRITTLHVLLWYVQQELDDETEKTRIQRIINLCEGQAKLIVSKKDMPTFMKIRKSKIDNNDINRLALCANYLRNKVSSLPDKKTFSEFIRERIQFIVIVADDHQTALNIALEFNKRSYVRQEDLIEQYICGLSEEARKIWTENILPLKVIELLFLDYMLRYISRRPISQLDIREFMRLFPVKYSINDIAILADIFHIFWCEPIDSIHKYLPNGFLISKETLESLQALRLLRRRDITVILFCIADKYGKEYIFNERLLNILVSYERYMAKKRPRIRKMMSWVLTVSKTPGNEKDVDMCFQDALDLISKTFNTDATGDCTFNLLA